MELDLRLVPGAEELRDDVVLFSESQSRFVVTVPPEHAAAFEAALTGVPFAAIGRVLETGLFLVVGHSGVPIIEADIVRLKAAWQQPLNW